MTKAFDVGCQSLAAAFLFQILWVCYRKRQMTVVVELNQRFAAVVVIDFALIVLWLQLNLFDWLNCLN